MIRLATLGAVALTFVSTAAQAATLSISDDPTLAYSILAAAGALVVMLAIGAYNMERRGH